MIADGKHTATLREGAGRVNRPDLFFADRTAQRFDICVCGKLPRLPRIAVDAFALIGVIRHIVIQPLAHHDTAQNGIARVHDRMGQAAFAVADEIPRANGVLRAAYVCRGRAGQDIDAFVFKVVNVFFGRLMAGSG